jgi:hypothetical protein
MEKLEKRRLFVEPADLQRLLACCETTSYRVYQKIRKVFGIAKPKKLTVDHVCIYFGITEDQYHKGV